MLYKLEKILSPLKLLSLGYIVIILTGGWLLTLPASAADGARQNFLDALFTSASAVSTTGLVVEDTGTFYSLTGQIIIMVLIQIGGLGYMLFFAAVLILARSRFSVGSKKYLRESVTRSADIPLLTMVKLTIYYTVIIETAGFIGYYLVWIKTLPAGKAAFYALFHSVSAFSTAGFGLFPDSLSSYSTSLIMNFNTFLLVITGGVGFFVLYDVQKFLTAKLKGLNDDRLSLHTKIVLAATVILFTAGTGLIYFSEGDKFTESYGQNILNAFFQAVSASTTVGFNSIDITVLSTAGLFVLIILMFIGASPGGTGGGIKTTTAAVYSASAAALLKGGAVPVLFRRSLGAAAVNRAYTQIFIAGTSVTAAVICLTFTENASFIKILFEAVSAFGTVGLSAGITPALSGAGKLLIILLMIIGRVGPLAAGLFFIRQNGYPAKVYPEEEVFI